MKALLYTCRALKQNSFTISPAKCIQVLLPDKGIPNLGINCLLEVFCR